MDSKLKELKDQLHDLVVENSNHKAVTGSECAETNKQIDQVAAEIKKLLWN